MELIPIRLHPGAGRERVVGLKGEAIKIEVSAPPLDGKANKALIKLLARLLGVPRGNIAIVRGEKSRDKLIRVEGWTARQLRDCLVRISRE